MKKLLLPLVAICTMLFSCSEDDAVASLQDANYNSSVTINNVQFAPVSTEDAKTSWAYGAPDIHERIFKLKDPATATTLQVHIVAHSTDATGTYNSSASAETENYLGGYFETPDGTYIFSPGSELILHDSGNNHYKLDFSNVNATNIDTQQSVELNGSFEGVFTPDPLIL